MTLTRHILPSCFAPTGALLGKPLFGGIVVAYGLTRDGGWLLILSDL